MAHISGPGGRTGSTILLEAVSPRRMVYAVTLEWLVVVFELPVGIHGLDAGTTDLAAARRPHGLVYPT